MRILSRCLTVSKTIEEVNKILRGSASSLLKPRFFSNQFSICVIRKNTWRGRFIIPIKGSTLESVDNTKVTLEVHAEVTIVISVILILLGLVGLLWCYVCFSERWFPFIGLVIMGMISMLQFIWDAKDALDQLENKLQR